MHEVIGVDIYNYALTGDVGRCLSTASGGLNEHIPIVIIIEETDGDIKKTQERTLHDNREHSIHGL